MAHLQLLKSTPSNSLRKFGYLCMQLNPKASLKKRIMLRNSKCINVNRSFSVSCRIEDGGSKKSNGEEPAESLFMKELKRRGMTPTSLLEEKNRSPNRDEETTVREDGGWRYSRTNDAETNVSNQRETSMALNSEGLEGLIPRGKLLLTLGGTFFLAFWPLILVAAASFFAVYLYFGKEFIHDGTDSPAAPPQYIDPYELLKEDRIYKTAPPLN